MHKGTKENNASSACVPHATTIARAKLLARERAAAIRWLERRESAPAARSRDRRSTDLARFGEVALFDCPQIRRPWIRSQNVGNGERRRRGPPGEGERSARVGGQRPGAGVVLRGDRKAAAVGGLGSRWYADLSTRHIDFPPLFGPPIGRAPPTRRIGLIRRPTAVWRRRMRAPFARRTDASAKRAQNKNVLRIIWLYLQNKSACAVTQDAHLRPVTPH